MIDDRIVSETDSETGNEMPLPEGWRLEKLGNLCELSGGTRDPRKTPSEQFRYVDITSVDNQAKRILETRSIFGKDAPSRARQVILENDVIVATTRPNLNAVALVSKDLDNQICSTGFCVLRPTAKLDAQYLFSFVRSELFVDSLSALVKGAMYPAVTDRQVKSQLIPLPPTIEEQRRIAAVLDEQMKAVEQARRAVDEQFKLFDGMIGSILRESQSNLLCKKMRFGEFTEEVKKGVGERWQDFPVLGATRSGLALAKDPVGKKPERYKFVDSGTIFYNPMRILLGSIAMVDDDIAIGITSPDYVVFKAKEGISHYRWLYHWMRSVSGENLIKTLARGAVRERILFNRLENSEVNLPDWETQVKAGKQFKLIANIKKTLIEQREAINKLPAPLLRRAFTGDI